MINQIIVDKNIRAAEFTPFAAWIKEKRITTPPKCIDAMTSSQCNDVNKPIQKETKAKYILAPTFTINWNVVTLEKKKEMPPQRRKCLPG